MYLSRLIIQNYRSIEMLNIIFAKGKNVIVGKNNSGKSNIISAINLVLGENSPTYEKSSNITLNDFYNSQQNHPIYICCEITREKLEDIDVVEISKYTKGYSKTADNFKLNLSKPSEDDPKSISDLNSQLEMIFQTDFSRLGSSDKIYIKDTDYIKELNDVTSFLYVFKAEFNIQTNTIQKELILLYKTHDSIRWDLANSTYFRNALLQSAVIPSFRQPDQQLKITDYNWYGKLLKYTLEHANSDKRRAFSDACNAMKETSQVIFKDLLTNIQDSHLAIAYPGTSLSFQCSPKDIDAYKQVLIYVNDGFESLLTEKGSGIQSTVIIGLFSYYMNNIVLNGSGLLVVEEPELYLHPHGRRVISQRLDDFIKMEKHQLILTTHSSEFFTKRTPDINIIRIHKGIDKKTRAFNINFSEARDLQIVLSPKNADMFFADKVILVEGSDKYILQEIAEEYGLQKLSDNRYWLDAENISIIPTEGKSKMLAHVQILTALGVEWYVITDFDFFLSGLKEFVDDVFSMKWDTAKVDDMLNSINGKIGELKHTSEEQILNESVMTQIASLVKLANSSGSTVTEKKIIKEIKKTISIKKIDDITDATLRTQIETILDNLKSQNIYILHKELEDYFTQKANEELSEYKGEGKEQKVIYLISNVLSQDVHISDLIECGEFEKILEDIYNSLNCEVKSK